MYDFLWSDFADWYVEIAKVQLDEGGNRAWTTLSILYTVLDQALRLLHPYIPFVSEETWQQVQNGFAAADLGIGQKKAPALIIAAWPAPGPTFPETAARFERVRELVRAVRATRSQYDVAPGRYIPALLVAGDLAPFLDSQRAILVSLARLDDEQLAIVEEAGAPENAITIALGDVTCYLPLAGMIDLAQERERLEGELKDVQGQITRLEKLLAGPFAEKAPADVVQKERDKLARYRAEAEELAGRLADLS